MVDPPPSPRAAEAANEDATKQDGRRRSKFLAMLAITSSLAPRFLNMDGSCEAEVELKDVKWTLQRVLCMAAKCFAICEVPPLVPERGPMLATMRKAFPIFTERRGSERGTWPGVQL